MGSYWRGMAPPERFPLTFSFPLFPTRLLSIFISPLTRIGISRDMDPYAMRCFPHFFPISPLLTMRLASHFFFGLHFTLFPHEKSNLPRECTRALHFFYLLNVTCLPDDEK